MMTILSVGAHMDDSEYGIGGILIQAVRDGHRVVCVVATGDYTSWASTVGREAACKQQQLDLAARFGYEKRFLNYKYHQVEADVAFKKQISEIYVEVKPDITFVHDTSDHWPDHVACGIGTKDAVLFSHGLSGDLSTQRCPRVFAYNLTPGQQISFEPDYFVDVTDVMPQYMELLQNTDSCLSGKPPEEMLRYEVKDLASGKSMKTSGHGWLRMNQCALWGQSTRSSAVYAIGLKNLWGPGETPLW
jgi:LmbE family N-acetylglucosaminyl deacetylase